MEPKYSVLLCGQILSDFENKISEWLQCGIKLFWFGTESECSILEQKYPEFSKAFLLNCYVSKSKNRTVIIDGKSGADVVDELEKEIPSFNAAQYRIEHCETAVHIVVEASAGTGKTTVMIDRIMFILHTVQGIKMSDIAMITFTNEATSQMARRLQKALLTRYRLTKQKKYLLWLEEQANMQISTIDSFSFSIMKKCGVVAGFSQQLRIKTLNYERKELIKDILNDLAVEGEKVSSQFGITYFKMVNLMNSFWNKISQLGLEPEEVLGMQWGNGNNVPSERFQEVLLKLIFELEKEYKEAKRLNDAVTLQELKRDINVVLPIAAALGIISDCGFKYLFVDEFQDSDNSQINMLIELAKRFDLRLFTVGDVKQSIYRFRGAVDSAFIRFVSCLKKESSIQIRSFELLNNYRTAPNVLLEFERYFEVWAREKLLTSSMRLRACKTIEGSVRVLRSEIKGFDQDLFIKEIELLLNDFKARYEKEERKPNSQNRVVVLTRTNRQVSSIARVLDKHKIPAIAKRDGIFYQTDAVKDFYAFISSFLYLDEPIYMFNYLKTPYSGIQDTIELSDLQQCDGDKNSLCAYLYSLIKKTKWNEYAKAFRIRPVLAVIKDVFEDDSYMQNFIARRKQIRLDDGWTMEDANSIVYAEAKQYQVNLEKLLEILHQKFKSDSVSINGIVAYLRNAIATNRDENEAEPEEEYQHNCVYCMTVHKAKGLEFDTVIIPMLDTPFYYRDQTEILIDNKREKVAWNIGSRDSNDELCNNYYGNVRKEENVNVAAEETRILYVAMTRTIHSFSCIMSKSQSANCWNGLFEKVYRRYE